MRNSKIDIKNGEVVQKIISKVETVLNKGKVDIKSILKASALGALMLGVTSSVIGYLIQTRDKV